LLFRLTQPKGPRRGSRSAALSLVRICFFRVGDAELSALLYFFGLCLCLVTAYALAAPTASGEASTGYSTARRIERERRDTVLMNELYKGQPKRRRGVS
jgi:hypothetical protein